ncbi:MAG: VanZ family protein [Ottowia sp.]|nr:VanZ family protein [Ottowia sp.]
MSDTPEAHGLGQRGRVDPALRRWKLLFRAWLLLTLVLLLSSGDMLRQMQLRLLFWLPLDRMSDEIFGLGLADKAVHLFLFAVMGALATRVWWGRAAYPRIMLALVLLGAGTEIAQYFIPGRGASIGDFAVDSLGLLLGFWFTRRYWLRALAAA